MFRLLFLLNLIISMVLITFGQKFDFINQDEWVKLSDDCGNPELNSSPRNIEAKKIVTGNCKGQGIKWQRIQKSNYFKMENTGKDVTWKPIGKDGEVFEGMKNQLVKFANQFSSTHTEYCIDNFHIHIPSEHNITGKPFSGELHFVHFSCKFNNIGEAIEYAIKSGDKFVLGVIGVFLKAEYKVDPPYELSSVDKYLPSIEHAGQSTKVKLEIENLLPKDLSFYSYLGGLTTPPCSPIVQWHVLKTPVKISKKSLELYRNLINFKGKPVIPNARFEQTNVNPILLCKDTSDDSHGSGGSGGSYDSLDKVKKAIKVGNTLTLLVLVVLVLFGIIFLIACLKIKARAYAYRPPRKCHPVTCKPRPVCYPQDQYHQHAQQQLTANTQAKNINLNF